MIIITRSCSIKVLSWMGGTWISSVIFIQSLISVWRHGGMRAVKLVVKLFHVWTLSSRPAPSACLLSLLLNTYRCDKTMLNTRADRDEMHERHILLLSVSNWKLFSGLVGWEKIKLTQNDDQRSTAWILMTLYYFLKLCASYRIEKPEIDQKVASLRKLVTFFCASFIL